MPDVVDAPDTEHNGQHYDCPPCFAIKVRTVQFGASTMPFRRPEAVRLTRDEKNLTRNLEAYKALRLSGVQPASTANAGDLANCDTKFEIESGNIVGAKMGKKIEGILDELPKGAQVRNPAEV